MIASNAAPPAPPVPQVKPIAPKRSRSRQTPPATAIANGAVRFGSIAPSDGHRIQIYGPGGIGKTTLAASAPAPVAMIDLDQSLSRLRAKLDKMALTKTLQVVEGVQTWANLRAMLAAPGWDKIKTIVIDSITVAEELAVAYTLATVMKERGDKARNIEDYGYGKGYQHIYETFLPLLADLDTHTRAGRHVILVAHECNSNVPNPMGADWIRYEPRLQTSASGKASIRLRLKEWVDHVLYVGYDVDVSKDKKAKGSGTATLYPSELPYFMAKSRTMIESVPLEACYTNLWTKLLI